MHHSAFFEVGCSYPHLTGSYEVLERGGEWLRVRLDDGREVSVTTENAFRILEEVGFFALGERRSPIRLDHRCEGTPCGPACIKLRSHSAKG